jgi:hypothetical protein
MRKRTVGQSRPKLEIPKKTEPHYLPPIVLPALIGTKIAGESCSHRGEAPVSGPPGSLSARHQRALSTRAGRISLLLAITLVSILVHGYHMGTDDAAIYAPGIEKAADPSLFPFGSEFFMHHAGLSLFPRLVASLTWLTGLPIEWSMLLWFGFAQFMLLWAAYALAVQCFQSERARWTGVGLLAALLSVPVAGTALILADSYLTSRSLSTPLVLMATVCFLGKRPRAACLWLVCAFLIHPQMAIYGAGFGLLLAVESRSRERVGFVKAALLLPALLLPFFAYDHLQPAQGAYREVLASRAYFLVTTWHWWEWVGAVAPLVILAVCAKLSPKPTLPAFSRLAKTLIGLGLISTVAALLLASDSEFAYLLRLQPMRSFHLIYVAFFPLLGGLVGEYLLRKHTWRWVLCFGVLAAGMFALDVATYPASPHIEWPGVHYQGEWLSSFLWIRDHTPKGAVFALDPEYLLKSGVDLHGFRAVAERSMLADQEKDSGAASVFPDLAERWKRESTAQSDWAHVSEERLQNLRAQYGVTWVLLESSSPVGGLVCPYRNGQLRVCRIVQASACLGLSPCQSPVDR